MKEGQTKREQAGNKTQGNRDGKITFKAKQEMRQTMRSLIK